MPATAAALPPRSNAPRPEDYVRRILQAEDFPAFSRQMGELMVTLDGGDASAQRLANLVLRDYALTVKVIRTANTIHYNRTGRPVQSATQAMMLLGARTVRDLAGELLLFEQYRKRSPGLKELMLLSLLTAGHAREAALRLGVGDPEAAQLAGMFRNLGEVLVAAHLPQEYAAVLRESTRTDRRDGRPGAPHSWRGYQQAVPGSRNTCRVIVFERATPSTVYENVARLPFANASSTLPAGTRATRCGSNGIASNAGPVER